MKARNHAHDAGTYMHSWLCSRTYDTQIPAVGNQKNTRQEEPLYFIFLTHTFNPPNHVAIFCLKRKFLKPSTIHNEFELQQNLQVFKQKIKLKCGFQERSCMSLNHHTQRNFFVHSSHRLKRKEICLYTFIEGSLFFFFQEKKKVTAVEMEGENNIQHAVCLVAYVLCQIKRVLTLNTRHEFS